MKAEQILHREGYYFEMLFNNLLLDIYQKFSKLQSTVCYIVYTHSVCNNPP